MVISVVCFFLLCIKGFCYYDFVDIEDSLNWLICFCRLILGWFIVFL